MPSDLANEKWIFRRKCLPLHMRRRFAFSADGPTGNQTESQLNHEIRFKRFDYNEIFWRVFFLQHTTVAVGA